MTIRSTESSSDYVIKSVKITKNGKSVEIRNNVEELNIFENLELPYLTGRILFKDDNRLFDSVGFDGVEECDITIAQPGTSSIDINKKFIIRSVSDAQKTGDLSEVISLNLIEKIGYDGMLNKFSKAYTGTVVEIITKIAKEKLEITIDPPKILPVQKIIRVVIPYLNPWEAISFILKKASTENGLPYYIYKSLNDDNLKMKSLEEMITEAPWNTNNPYRYSKAYTQSSSDPDAEPSLYNVEKYGVPQTNEDTLRLILNGSVGAKYSVTDSVTGRTESGRIDMKEIFNRLESRGIISSDNKSILNTQYTNKVLSEQDSRVFHTVVMTNTYDEVPNYYQEEQYDLYRIQNIKNAFDYLIFKSAINLVIPGIPFLTGKNASIGRRIKYFHMNNDLQATEKKYASEKDFKDLKRSGSYMIYSTKHTFYATRHRVTLTAVKLGNDVS